jgi:hypothetical protein
MVPECYMCDAAAVTKEHAPPQSFYPERLRVNLITVPSCAAHNTSNSKDVEYVRNVLSTQYGTNDVASEVFETVKRSFENSPKLLRRTFRDLRPHVVHGTETGAFPIDLPRLKVVIGAIGHAFYFRDHAKKHRGDWQIFAPTLGYAPSILDGQPDPWERLRQIVESGQYEAKPSPHPEVFEYGVVQMDDNQLIYRFAFYEHIVVNAWTHFHTFVHW